MKKIGIGARIGLTIVAVAFLFVVFGTLQAPRTESVQHGYRGTGMDLIYNRAQVALARADNSLPSEIPKGQDSGKKAKDTYKNLKVLGDLDVSEFNRLMASMATWVAPSKGCLYCHTANGNFASDDLYTKKVARRMLQMTRHINADWKSHVAETGVTCWTCHRGQPVPAYVWFNNPGPASGMAIASAVAGDTALPNDPFTPYLEKSNEIRVNATRALPGTDYQSIKQTEGTYSLMMHMSRALGVNCTYCHNTRAFSNWSQSTPQRKNAWYGIRMVRDVNEHYLGSLSDVFPVGRLGPHGDVPKVNCTTCHQGAYKPLLGASMLKTYDELKTTQDVASVKPEEAAPAATPGEAKPDQAKPDQAKPDSGAAPAPPSAPEPGK